MNFFNQYNFFVSRKSNKRFGSYVAIFILLTITFIQPIFSQPSKITEADYTYKFNIFIQIAEFTEWPTASEMNNASKPFTIGIIGNETLDKVMKATFENKKIKNKVVTIRLISNLSEIQGCHILFIPKSESDHLSEILAFIKDKPIVSISESQGFAQKGVMINFVPEKVGKNIEVNEKAAKAAQINFDYGILQIAIETY